MKHTNVGKVTIGLLVVAIVFILLSLGSTSYAKSDIKGSVKQSKQVEEVEGKRVVCIYKGHGGVVKTKNIATSQIQKTGITRECKCSNTSWVKGSAREKIKKARKNLTCATSTTCNTEPAEGCTCQKATNESINEAKPEEVSKDFEIKLSFTGDVMIASYKDETKPGNFNDVSNKEPPTYFLQNIVPIFEKDDFTIINLENVLTDNPLKELAKNHNPAYWYKSRTSNTEILTSSSVEVVNLSNNHTNDYGKQGMTDTIEAVTKAGLEYGTSDKTLYLEKDGVKIALICNGLWSEGQAETIIARLKEAEKQSDYQIVFYHGGKERVHTPEEWRIRASRKLVDNGADLVIGNHPHVLQPMETYNNVKIIYSLGNFLFGGSNKPENRTVILQQTLKVSTDTKEIISESTELIPCYVYTGSTNNWQPDIITDEQEKQKVLDFMAWKSELPY